MSHAPHEDNASLLILDSEREPVRDAVVAVIPAGRKLATEIVRSDAEGRAWLSTFDGSAVITATHPTAGIIAVETTGERLPEELVLSQEKCTGEFVVQSEASVSGQWIRIERYSLKADTISYARTDVDGHARAPLPCDTYSVSVEGPDTKSLPLFVNVSAGRATLHGFSAELLTRAMPQADVSEVSSEATPLSLTDFDSLKQSISRSAVPWSQFRVLVAGEATHGASEFFRIKHALCAYLIEELGYRDVIFEVGSGEGQAINDFIQGRTEDLGPVMESISYGVWRTEEVAAFLTWLRAYNERQPLDKRVRFWGMDVKSLQGPAIALQTVLEDGRIDPDPAIEEALELLTKSTAVREYKALPDRNKAGLREALSNLLTRLEKEGRELERARQHVWSIQTALELYDAPNLHDAILEREQGMAQNVLRILRDGGRRAFVWTHNYHSSKSTADGRATLGSVLQSELADDAALLGFVFDSGSFRAYDPSERKYSEFSVSTGGAGNVGHSFAKTKAESFILPLAKEHAPATAWRKWLTRPRRLWQLGAIFSGHDVMDQLGILTDMFDLVVFVDDTTAARSWTEDE